MKLPFFAPACVSVGTQELTAVIADKEALVVQLSQQVTSLSNTVSTEPVRIAEHGQALVR
jgi:hypothetical protein